MMYVHTLSGLGGLALSPEHRQRLDIRIKMGTAAIIGHSAMVL